MPVYSYGMGLSYLRLRPAKTEEVSPDAQVGLLASILHMGKKNWWQVLSLKPKTVVSFELISTEQRSMFYLSVPQQLGGYYTSQVVGQYPKTLVVAEQHDPLEKLLVPGQVRWGYIRLAHAYAYPIRTYKGDFELYPMAALLGFMAKLQPGEAAVMQVLVRITNSDRIQRKVRGNLKTTNAEGEEETNPYQHVITKKLAHPVLQTQIRIGVAAAEGPISREKLEEFAGTFGVYTLAEGNALLLAKPAGWRKNALEKKVAERQFLPWSPTLYLNLEELASLWHLPDQTMEKVKMIDWGKTVISEAPENMAVAEQVSVAGDKREVNFFAKTEWRNHEAIFGIKREDRRKHVYIIGKTGSGKSTLIANMAINDIRNGEGVAVIDPHGDLTEMILRYIPKRRAADVIYLDPTLTNDRSFSLNLFDDDGATHRDVVASGIVSVLYKLYHHSWGPRLEYILRNTILTLLHYPEATFADIPRMLTDQNYREKALEHVKGKDHILMDFWRHEFEKMSEKLRVEAISPILNKVGQFLSSQRIRHIVGEKHSTFSLEEVMNGQKILLLNLSQGKLGEDTAALLGAIFITKMQLTAMNRVRLAEEGRRDFYLYVDEFQNFATTSFVKILSEARKYRLNLIMANQYIAQVDEQIQHAVFGNVGSLISFVIGATDAAQIEREFGGVFEANELVGLGKYEILLKMAIDGLTSEPFLARTLPLPSVVNDNAEKIVRLSVERYYRKVK